MYNSEKLLNESVSNSTGLLWYMIHDIFRVEAFPVTCAFMSYADAANTEALSENNWEKYQQLEWGHI